MIWSAHEIAMLAFSRLQRQKQWKAEQSQNTSKLIFGREGRGVIQSWALYLVSMWIMTSQSITREYHTYTTHFSAHYLQKGFKWTFHYLLTMLQTVVAEFKVVFAWQTKSCLYICSHIELDGDRLKHCVSALQSCAHRAHWLIPGLQDIRYE